MFSFTSTHQTQVTRTRR